MSEEVHNGPPPCLQPLGFQVSALRMQPEVATGAKGVVPIKSDERLELCERFVRSSWGAV
eukprot:CAMPEP_0180441704 /NCGR_PEP_ID=MMETSP1036_2-20121128/13763_1 /TAXON_ID=632150 /ORGANISM="Azadinium spinosum, Strain 3D9" /LENGTH=59 /DNA_ID=CAMNT_0022447927 /DNA_START=652 /DNA_END=831 /DNA_ORIENTATION=+